MFKSVKHRNIVVVVARAATFDHCPDYYLKKSFIKFITFPLALYH